MMKAWLLMILFSVTTCSSFAATTSDWQEVSATNMDATALSVRGKAVLASTDLWKWKHAQTEHFVVHFESGIFAAKVARMGEFFYDYIGKDLQGVKDTAPGRSHIFIFRNEKEWTAYQTQFGGPGTEWAYSMVEGYVMYLQQAGDIKSSGDVLGHEMTHMVVNRFMEKRLPVWLNEGIAEWYEEFAYAEFKGVKKSKKAQFRDLKVPYQLHELVTMETYPKSVRQVHQFYQTSKYLVAFLMLEHPVEKFLPFANDIAARVPPADAFERHYNYQSIESLQADFLKFIK